MKQDEGTNGLSRFAVYMLKHGMPHSTKRHTTKKDRLPSRDADLPVIYQNSNKSQNAIWTVEKKNVQLSGYSFV